MNNEWNVPFLKNTTFIQKVSIQTLYLSKRKCIMHEKISFRQVFFVLHKFIPVSFHLVEATLNLFLFYGMKLHHCISFNAMHVIKSLKSIFSRENNKKSREEALMSKFFSAYAQCITKNIETGFKIFSKWNHRIKTSSRCQERRLAVLISLNFIIYQAICMFLFKLKVFSLVWFVWFYGISTIIGYSMPNPFLYTEKSSISNNSV